MPGGFPTPNHPAFHRAGARVPRHLQPGAQFPGVPNGAPGFPPQGPNGAFLGNFPMQATNPLLASNAPAGSLLNQGGVRSLGKFRDVHALHKSHAGLLRPAGAGATNVQPNLPQQPANLYKRLQSDPGLPAPSQA